MNDGHCSKYDTEEEGVQGELFADATSDEKEELDPKGDLVLVVQRRHLLVSSRVLELSCPFFKKMLQSNAFLEGVDQPNAEQPPTKRLREDHPDMFSLICRVVHYRPAHPPDSVDGYHLLADLCNFYGCSWALSFHVRAWLESWDLSNLSSKELQKMLWVSFVFHLCDKFQCVSLHLAEAFTVGEWKAWEVQPMPAQLKGTLRKSGSVSQSIITIFADDMRELYERVKNKVQQQIELVIDEVGENSERHTGKLDKICAQCFRNKPLATRRCGACGSSNFGDYTCTKEVRLSLFKEWLQSQGYWPLSRLIEQSCRNFLGAMPAPTGNQTPCGFGDSCPLMVAKKRLIARLRANLADVVGLRLEDYDAECLTML
jgi:hypothetical protein